LAGARTAVEDARQECTAEQRDHAERQEADDGECSPAGAPLARIVPVVVGVLVLAILVGGVVEVVDVLGLTVAGDGQVRWRWRVRLRGRRCRSRRRRSGWACPLIAVAGQIRRRRDDGGLFGLAQVIAPAVAA